MSDNRRGKRDIAALREIGFTGEIIAVHAAGIYEFCETLPSDSGVSCSHGLGRAGRGAAQEALGAPEGHF